MAAYWTMARRKTSVVITMQISFRAAHAAYSGYCQRLREGLLDLISRGSTKNRVPRCTTT